MDLKDHIVAVKMSTDLRSQLLAEGAKRGLSMSSLLRMVCHEWLDKNAEAPND